MAANWHLGDVGSTTDFSINASLGHPGAPYSSGSCEGLGVPGWDVPWTSIQERAALGLVTILLPSIIQQLKSSLIPSLKKETLKSLLALNSHFAFSEPFAAAHWLSYSFCALSFFYHSWKILLLEAIIQHQSQIHNSFRFINSFQIHNFPLNLSSSISPWMYQYRAIVSDNHIYMCNMQKYGFSPYRSANSCLNLLEFRRG